MLQKLLRNVFVAVYEIVTAACQQTDPGETRFGSVGEYVEGRGDFGESGEVTAGGFDQPSMAVFIVGQDAEPLGVVEFCEQQRVVDEQIGRSGCGPTILGVSLRPVMNAIAIAG